MSYSSWETEEGVAIEQVATFTRHLLSNQRVFDDNTNPPIDEVHIFLTNNYAKMAGALAKYGISTAQTDTVVKSLLTSYQVYMTALDVELTQKIHGVNGQGSPRMAMFEKKANEFYHLLENGSLFALPNIDLISETDFVPLATGTSIARQRLIESDTDFKKADITRDLMVGNRVLSDRYYE